MNTDESIHISLLLASNQRSDAAKDKAERLCVQLGMNVLSSGSSSLCCQLPAKQFKKLFGVAAPERKGSVGDPAEPAGFEEPIELAVPKLLQGIVDIVSIEPPAQQMR